MGVVTLQGIVENGQIRLPADVTLPDHAVVYVVVPDAAQTEPRAIFHVPSPRLIDPSRASALAKHVIEQCSHDDRR
jgi:hypothetical protein